jgi:hypothetical protein
MINKRNGVLTDARGVAFEVGQDIIFTPSGERQIVLLGEIMDIGKNNVVLGRLRNLNGLETAYYKENIRTTSSTMVIVDKLPAAPAF